jgi:hypothetical protein
VPQKKSAENFFSLKKEKTIKMPEKNYFGIKNDTNSHFCRSFIGRKEKK